MGKEYNIMRGYQKRLTLALVHSLAGLCVELLLAAAVVASSHLVCEGPYTGGRKPTPDALSQALTAHATWLLTPQHADAQRANLCGADLQGVRLSGMNLARIDLHGARLTRALLGRANLREANLRQANLQQAVLEEADLQDADLQQANLRGAYLAAANLQRANLYAINLQEAILLGAKLHQAQLGRADFQRAVVKHADLTRARLVGTDLRDADLRGVNLAEATLIDVRLDGSRLMDTELAAVVFEPDYVTLPPAANFALARNLSRLTFQTSSYALVTLRALFKQAGMHQQERALTFAINHELGRQAQPVERAVRFVFFELTCQYGMAPWRPLLILGLLICCGATPYALALHQRGHSMVCMSRTWGNVVRYWTTLALIGLCCSFLAAMFLGRSHRQREHWQCWLLRYTTASALPAWMSGLAILQCFSSLYLMILWVLVTLGQPFA
jgi:uncharacterized protein YjbI with pentapeptide repeats